MRKEATLTQWQHLYEEIDRYKKEKPWETFEDLEIFALKIPDVKGVVYCSIMGYHETCVGLGIYHGKQAKEALAVASSENTDLLKEYLSFETGWLAMYLDSPELISDKQRDILEQLNRDVETSPQLMALEKHCMPDDPMEHEVVLMLKTFQALNEAIPYFYALKEDFDFEHYLFQYDIEKKTHRKVKIRLHLPKYPFIVIDEDEIEQLLELPRNHEVWSMDLIYSDAVMPRDKDGRLERTKLFLVENQTMDLMISAIPLIPKDELDIIIDEILGLMEEHGIPEKLAFRNPQVLSIIATLCEQLQIGLSVTDEMEIIDDFIEMMEQEESDDSMMN